MTTYRSKANLALGKFDQIGARPESPGTTRSVLLYFVDQKGERLEWALGTLIETVDGAALAPGLSNLNVTLTFWEQAAVDVVKPGAQFLLWYGGDIGQGEITAPLVQEEGRR